MYEFELNDTIARNDCFYIQVKIKKILGFKNCLFYKFYSPKTALLYTTSTGERRIRVHNYGIVVSNVVSEIYGAIDPSTLSISLARQAVYKVRRLDYFSYLIKYKNNKFFISAVQNSCTWRNKNFNNPKNHGNPPAISICKHQLIYISLI
jgi:hypothetical protein